MSERYSIAWYERSRVNEDWFSCTHTESYVFPITESEGIVKSQCGEEEDTQRNYSDSLCQKKAKQKIQSNPKRKESQQCLKMKGG